jgi:hypothetical protein
MSTIRFAAPGLTGSDFALHPAELGQITGRAGRYVNDGTFMSRDAELFDQTVERLENHRSSQSHAAMAHPTLLSVEPETSHWAFPIIPCSPALSRPD